MCARLAIVRVDDARHSACSGIAGIPSNGDPLGGVPLHTAALAAPVPRPAVIATRIVPLHGDIGDKHAHAHVQAHLGGPVCPAARPVSVQPADHCRSHAPHLEAAPRRFSGPRKHRGDVAPSHPGQWLARHCAARHHRPRGPDLARPQLEPGPGQRRRPQRQRRFRPFHVRDGRRLRQRPRSFRRCPARCIAACRGAGPAAVRAGHRYAALPQHDVVQVVPGQRARPCGHRGGGECHQTRRHGGSTAWPRGGRPGPIP